MKYKIFVIVFILSLHVTNLSAQPVLKEPALAKRIAGQMRDRDDGQTRYSRVLLVTCSYINKDGKRIANSTPIRKYLETITIDVGQNLENTTSLGIINNPPSEKNMAFLQKDYDQEGKQSDQWMYFPALKKLKRIVSQSDNSPKDGSVFGSEISYEDIEKLHLSNYQFSYEGTEIIDGRNCHVIYAFPTEEYSSRTTYSKEIYWIDQSTHIPLKREMFDKRGELLKTFYCKDIVEINDVWLYKRRIVVNHDNHHMSMEKFTELIVNIPINNELVGLRALKDVSFREAQLQEIRNYSK